MARGTTLSNLRLMLRAEIGQSMVAAAGAQNDARSNYLLSNKQKWLASEYDWPFLEERWDLPVGPGARYVALPTMDDAPDLGNVAINFERPVKVEVKYNQYWKDVEYGIGSEEYNARDSDLQVGEDPIQKWRFATNVNEQASPNQIELWPIPTSQQTIRFSGQRALYTLADNADTADLDDMLIVLFVAAELTMEENETVSKAKMVMAHRRLQQLRQVYPVKENRVVLGKRKLDLRAKRLVPIATVAGSAGSGTGLEVGTGTGLAI